MELVMDEEEESGSPRRFFLHAATLHDDDGTPIWWSATQVVRVDPRDMLAALDPARALTIDPVSGAGGPSFPATIIADLSPLDSGLDEMSERFGAPWSSRKPEPVTLTFEALLEPVSTQMWGRFRGARGSYRSANAMPRYVVRSDVRSDSGRLPLYALRHPWPGSISMQGGSATRHIEMASATETVDGSSLPDEAHVIQTKSGQWRGWVRDRVFIEAFPSQVDTAADGLPGGFMRGTGTTFAEAEDALWKQWTDRLACPSVASVGSHRWETRGYRNGAGFCADCGAFGSQVFDLAEIGSLCHVCGEGTYWQSVTVPADREPEFGPSLLLCREHAAPDYEDVSNAIHARSGEQGRSLLDELLAACPPGTTASQLRDDVDLRFAALRVVQFEHALGLASAAN